MHLILGDGERPPFRPEEFDAYAARGHRALPATGAPSSPPAPSPPTRIRSSECDFCPWWKRCADRRRDEDHLSLVAMLQRDQGLKLEAAGVHSVGELAALPRRDARPAPGRARRSTACASRPTCSSAAAASRRPLYALHEPEHGRGLARLPRPSEGDVFFDFEGDPYWGDEGLEYLFGTVYHEDGEWRYWPLWAETRARGEGALRGVDGLDHRAARARIPTCTSSTSTPTSRSRSSG